MISPTVNIKIDNQLSKKLTQHTAKDSKKEVYSNKLEFNVGLRLPGSNWQKFKTLTEAVTFDQNSNNSKIKKKKHNHNHIHKPAVNQLQNGRDNAPQGFGISKQNSDSCKEEKIRNQPKPHNELTKVITMDCQTIGIGEETTIANDSIVNRNEISHNKCVEPVEKEVTGNQNLNNSNIKKNKRNRNHTYKSAVNQLENCSIIASQSTGVNEQTSDSNEVKDYNKKPKPHNGLTKVIAMDCEMVGIGDGTDSMIARVSIVNRNGVCIYDKYVKPTEEVKDYRTAVSGIRPHHLKNGENFKTVQQEVSDILKGRILVGHALHNDLAVLFLSHPKWFQRDTARYKLFRKVTKGRTPSLKTLAAELLGIDIQSGEHNSIEDARAAMQLYQLFRKKWETDQHKSK